MARPRTRFAIALALLVVAVEGAVALAAYGFWLDLDAGERALMHAVFDGRMPLFALAAFFLPFLLGALLRKAFNDYPLAAAKIGEALHVMHTVNPKHRVEAVGGAEMRELAAALNAFADAHEALQRDVDARVEESNARLQQQKNRLAALMSQLAQSVLVCNAEGRILLYNARATKLLERDAGAPVGLGRSVFGVLDKSLVVHALDQIRQRIAQRSADPVAQFVTARGGRLVRVQMAPVLHAHDAIGGFVLVMADITRTMEVASRRDFLLQQLTEQTRASLANIRAAAETMQQYPQMDGERRQRFTDVIRYEAEKLSLRIDDTLARHPDTLRAQWPLDDMPAADLMLALQRNLETTLGVTAHFKPAGAPVWLSVDSYSLVQALTHMAANLASHFNVRSMMLEIAAEGRLARLSLRWHGPPLDASLLHAWEQEPFAAGVEGAAPTLRDVLERHGGEVWCRADAASGDNRLSVELPLTQPEHVEAPAKAAEGRPVYYDFDLFSQPGQTPELDERRLGDLTYTVFDTETTGLSPSEGDEIISIGAVRIVNGRLLEHECFERLIDPGRPVKRESQLVHGLTDQVLAGQPAIDQVLPLFARFAEDTVLVAHNAAFDMRFLQLKEAATGVKFIQPVLDTLLLSALVHPGHGDAEHRLEQIAARLGIPIIGRHTALGDAIVTGEVFLKLIPLLAARGIHTLKQAREASQRTLYAKLEY
jgi:DNA polymerase-3 subunit epsilon